MKTVILAAALLAFAVNVQAAEKKPTVGQTMKDMGKLFKQLKADVADPKKNASSLQAAKDLEKLFTTSLTQVDEGVAIRYPENQRKGEAPTYKKLIEDGLVKAKALVAALSDNGGNNELAKRLVDELRKNETDGHDRYKKDE